MPTRLAVSGSAPHTERLLLRRLTLADVAESHAVTGDPAVMRYWYPGPDAELADTAARVAEIEAHWREHGFGDFGVVSRDSGALLGFAGLHHIADMAEVNLGYALVPGVWRRGLGSELCATLLEYGFIRLGLPEIVAVVDPRNAASVALARRSGFSLRHEATWQGQARLVFALTQAEFEARR